MTTARPTASGAPPEPPGGASPGGSRDRTWRVAWRAVGRVRRTDLTDRAASLAFFGILAIFPALICLVAVTALAGQDPGTVNAIFAILSDAGATGVAQTLKGPLGSVINAKGGSGALLGVGVLITIWSASGYLRAFSRAADALYEVRETRPFWRLRPLQIALTLALVVGTAIVAAGLVISGRVAEAVGRQIGVGSAATTAWDVAKWPVIIIVALIMVGILEWAAPNVPRDRLRVITPGAVVSVTLWGVTTALFGLYVGFSDTYNATYGTLGGAIALLVWLWLINMGLLIGIAVNAELYRPDAAPQPDDGGPAAATSGTNGHGPPPPPHGT
jgi:membrane protein